MNIFNSESLLLSNKFKSKVVDYSSFVLMLFPTLLSEEEGEIWTDNHQLIVDHLPLYYFPFLIPVLAKIPMHSIDARNPQTGKTLLHYAIMYRSKDVFTYLLQEKKANIQIICNNGESILLSCISYNVFDWVDDIYKADERIVRFINFPNKFGVTPLSRAVHSYNLKAVNWLFQHNVSVAASVKYLRNMSLKEKIFSAFDRFQRNACVHKS